MKQRNADKKLKLRIANYELNMRESKNSAGYHKPASHQRH